MEIGEAFGRLENILSEVKVGILSTVDDQGKPHMRWMTPIVAKGRKGCLYAVSSPRFRKVAEIEACPDVAWLFQTKALDEIMLVRGKICAIDNPQLKSEIIEGIGRNLEIFWRTNPNESEMVVLETTIEEIEYQLPLKGRREIVKLGRNAE
jgi:general stress protein 26